MGFWAQLTPRGKFNVVLFFVIFPVVGLGTLFVLLNLDSWLAARPSLPVTFDTIASHEGDKVSIDGRFRLGGIAITSNCQCGGGPCADLEFVSGDDSSRQATVLVELAITYTQEPNHFYLPDFYTDEDFKIYTNEGQALGYQDVIRVIGTVRDVGQANGNTTVYLCPTQIEVGD